VNFFNISSALALVTSASIAVAQNAPAPNEQTDVQLLQKQMLEMQASIRQTQAQHAQEIEALKAQVAAQQKALDDFKKMAGASAPPLPAGPAQSASASGPIPTSSAAPPLFPTTDSSVVATSPTAAASVTVAQPATAPDAIPTIDTSVVAGPTLGGPPITLAGGGKTYLNISLDVLINAAASTARDLEIIEVGDHDPLHRGFNARNTELVFDGAVDPYFEGFANIVFKLDPQNETSVEVEEAFAQTTSLPWNLQVKAGQFFSPFGRINSMHPHTWDFIDAPLVHGRLLGPDGLRGVGAQVSWIVPTPWYSQLMLAVQNGEGSTGFSFRNRGDDDTFVGRETIDRQLRGIQDFVFVPRWESAFDFGSTRTLLTGISAAFGPNDTGATAHTQIYAVDAFYKWKPANAGGGWPYVKWQSEAMYRRFEAGRGLDDSFAARETFNDWGAYSQIVWGFKTGWSAGVRGDYLHMSDSQITDDPERQSRWRLSADLTWFPSEFSKLRLQYNHDFLEASHFLSGRDVDSIFLQFEFALGAHGAHKF
jgi:hypothetical protein